jgi:hypothetical protein
MIQLDIDWAYLRLANHVLAEYILLPETYRPLIPVKTSSGFWGVSQLAIGNILLSLKRLQAVSPSGSEKSELTELCKQIEQVRDRWRANWERKARREMSDRLHFWQIYLKDVVTEKKWYSRSYPTQARLRAIIYLLDEEIGTAVLNRQTALEQQDNLLRSISSPGPFVWEVELAGGFPEDSFWFLYRSFV